MDFRAALLDQTRSFGELIASSDPETPVPTCPDWTLKQLFRHVGRGNRWAAQIISERRVSPLDPREVHDGKPPDDPDAAIEWLNEPNIVLWALILVVVWHGVGFYLVLFSAAMQAIPRDIYEAALIDGAGRAHTFFRITLPLLWDSVQTAWVYLGIAAMDMFILVSTMTAGEYGGGPDHHSEVMATVMMRNFLLYGRSGYACAMGVVMLLLTLIVSVVMLRATRRERVEF